MMPHYKDGTPAEVGDFVKGKPYNTDHEVVGTVVQITEDSDVCNCIVAFAEPIKTELPLEKLYPFVQPPLYWRGPWSGRIPSHGSESSVNVLILPRLDDGELRAFERIGSGAIR